MPAPHPIELRERIVRAYKAGRGTYEEIAELFGVGVASVDRYVALDRECGSVEPKPSDNSGPDPLLDDADLARVRVIVETRPDATLREIADAFIEQTGRWASESTIGRAVRERLQLTRKKRRSSRANATGRRSPRSAKRS